MRILWIGSNDEYMINSTTYYLRKALEKQADVTPVGLGFQKPVEKDVLKLVKIHKPEAIVIVSYLGTIRANLNKPFWKNLHLVKVPKALLYGDPHKRNARVGRAAWIYKNKINMTLHWAKECYHNPTETFHFSMEDFKAFVIGGHFIRWLPWSVDTNIIKDYGYERIYDVGFFGRVTGLYPLRKKMLRVLKERDEFTKFIYKKPRGASTTPERRKRLKMLVREDYAKAINRCKLWPIGGSRYRLAQSKYIECMGCGTLLLANAPMDAEALHFKDGYNFVEIDGNNFMDKILHYIDDDSERKRIASNGIKTVLKYHTSDIRAGELIGYLQELLDYEVKRVQKVESKAKRRAARRERRRREKQSSVGNQS